MKKITALVMALILLGLSIVFSGCTKKGGEDKAEFIKENLKSIYSIEDLKGTELNVYNWGEYISDGTEGSVDIIKKFEELTGIKVNYTTYASNEDMYSKLKSGGVNYDVIIPSDYMAERLKKENALEKLDFKNIPNFQGVAEEYKNLFFDKSNEYSVAYTGGMVGLIYNKTMVKEVPDSWSALWDNKYKGQMLTFNNSRDAFGIAQYLLNQDVNTTNPADWAAAKDKLIEQKPLLQSYVMDEVFNKMESGEAALAPYYAGDFLTMKAQNSDLEFIYPKEGTNIFVDVMCVPKGAQHKRAAELFINFMLEPETALHNANFMGYICPVSAVLSDERYEYKDNEVLYPKNPPKTQYFHNLDQSTLDLLSKLWEEVKIA
ncbi:MAG: ABC transporter substrate-binding protein [Candidatus Fimenecus sp.]